jgi:hypothetical protein
MSVHKGRPEVAFRLRQVPVETATFLNWSWSRYVLIHDPVLACFDP